MASVEWQGERYSLDFSMTIGETVFAQKYLGDAGEWGQASSLMAAAFSAVRRVNRNVTWDVFSAADIEALIESLEGDEPEPEAGESPKDEAAS